MDSADRTLPLPLTRPGGESWQDMTTAPGVIVADEQQHRIVAVRDWRGGSGAAFTDWRARCGTEGEIPADLDVIDWRGRPTDEVRQMACMVCWGVG